MQGMTLSQSVNRAEFNFPITLYVLVAYKRFINQGKIQFIWTYKGDLHDLGNITPINHTFVRHFPIHGQRIQAERYREFIAWCNHFVMERTRKCPVYSPLHQPYYSVAKDVIYHQEIKSFSNWHFTSNNREAYIGPYIAIRFDPWVT